MAVSNSVHNRKEGSVHWILYRAPKGLFIIQVEQRLGLAMHMH